MNFHTAIIFQRFDVEKIKKLPVRQNQREKGKVNKYKFELRQQKKKYKHKGH